MSEQENIQGTMLLQSFAADNNRYDKIKNVEDLQACLQDAITLEFATIPAYLTAMYSMKDATSSAYRITKTVALEEMFHVYQAANLLISIGGTPKLTGDRAVKYPSYIPRGDQNETPCIKPSRATKELYLNTFMGIEKPSPANAKPQDKNVETIGQFYLAIREGFKYLADPDVMGKKLFNNTKGYTQQQNFNIGNGGGQIINVTDLDSAILAIEEITEQGEGCKEPDGSTKNREPWGIYNGYEYNLKQDENDNHHYKLMYGPMDKPTSERSHYQKFKRIASGEIPLPATYPIVSTTSRGLYGENQLLLDIRDAFDGYYSVLLHVLEASFKQGDSAQNIYFQAAMPLMHTLLPTLARKLMKSPLPDCSGLHAAPSWTYIDKKLKHTNTLAQSLCNHYQQLIAAADSRDKLDSYQSSQQTMENILRIGQQIQSLFEKNNIDF
ncbi:ferritin-like protein [Candidatus Albibeggiatoa sp. nov. NOAA]|uniref:ferritin-like domain-containing protein n=1 Tax=Candidatus Albibeggiatoa sp. nov. NOAA TaxID=3162724 RepID=UPI0032F66788|nr:ferritin-like protein [Thiotrichaceae bacterium]